MKLSKLYEPQQYETDIYDLWEQTGAFVPKNRGHKDTFSIVMPPPNANGDLHIGHALTIGIEDTLVRYHRLTGKAALLLPGADHAGFETQVVFEKNLAKEGKSRFDFSREELYLQIWDFVSKNRDNYESQFRQLGAGVDWSRYVYTLDEKIVKQAYATFKKMWDEGLIYRGERLVNFCTFHGTGFADIEVEYEEVKGNLWEIRYPLTDGSGEIVVATTRPETMLGDVAVAVHPKDKRFAGFIGKTVKLPLTSREIPIIADEMVDMAFGTGAVKITPAHDINDYDVAGRHDLPFITVIGHDGKLVHEVGKSYSGLTVKDARKKIVEDLKKESFLVSTTDHLHNVGHCYKCGTIIEPLLREQWFVDMQPLAKRAIEVLQKNSIDFYPESKKMQLIKYLQNLRDWNISRQIAWGIPIPAFQSSDDPNDWIFDERVDQETIEVDGKTYHRDPDVFDTWFSSSSWPYATLDYPDGEDFHSFYPLSVMNTAGDILYQWVSRMIMLGLYTTDSIPFETVYLHGLVLDDKGAKMSKSKGNVVSPIEKVEQFGSDALRLGLLQGQSAGQNQPFGEAKLITGRNFCNKLWNIARFIEDTVGDDAHLRVTAQPETEVDHWVLSKLQHSIKTITHHLEHFQLSEAYDVLYHTVWDDVADWYIEASKGQSNPGLLAYILETILKLAHPFAPFVTETIWQTLAWEADSVLAVSQWPKSPKFDRDKADNFEQIIRIVSECRHILNSLRLKNINLYFKEDAFLQEHAAIIKRLAKLGNVSSVRDGRGLNLTTTNHACWLDIDQQSIRNYVGELQKKSQSQQAIINNIEGRLSNESYVHKAPKAIIDQSRDQLKEAQTLLTKMQLEINRFTSD